MGKTEVIAEDNRLMKVCLLTAIGTGLTVLGDSYGTMLFLTYYKADSLPYLYVTLGLLSLATSQVLQNWQQKDMISCLKKSHIGFIITLLASFYLLVYEVAHAAFLLSLLTLATAFTILTSYWNLVSMIFDLREFKQLGRWILASSTLGGLIIGIIVPILLKFVPPNALLILFIVLIFLAYLLLLSVHVKKTQIIAPNKRTHSSSSYSLLRQPLFLYLFASYFLVIFTHISIDFNLKKELYLVYNEVQIGSFLAPFFAITMGITIIGQFFILPIIIRMTGVVGLIAICSIITLVGSLFVFQYPSLISATILTGFEEVARFTFYSMGLKMVINVFPQRARIEANFLLKNKARNISAILAAALLSIFVKLQWYQFIMILVFTVSIIMIFIAVKVSKYYYITLKNSINLHRFSDEYLTIKRTDDAFRNRVIKIAIEEKSEDAVIFALSLLQNQRLKEIPNYVMEQLNNKSILVRKLLIKIVRDTKNKGLIDRLYKQLEVETDHELVWKLSEAILAVKPNLFLPKANEDIRSESILVRSRVICAYALTGDEKKIKVAQKLYRNMISSDSAKDRLWATKILYCSPQVEDSPSSLSKKFKDSDLQVVLSLARAARKIYDEKIIDVMLDGLAKPELRYSFSKTLLNIGIACREQLLNKIENTEKNSLVRHLVYLLASFEQPKIEKDLINLSLSPNITLSSIAIYNLAYRTRKWPLSEDSKNSVSYLIDKTISFSQILMQERSRTSSQFMLIEINSRLTMLKQNYLYLLSVYFKSEVILELSPTLLKPKQYKNLQARALELLETCVNEPDLKASITIVLEEEIIPKYNASKNLKLVDLDLWFKTLSLYSNKMLKGKLMDTISKVLILRKLSIFEELSPEAIQSVAENLETQEIIAGEEVFSEGDYADGLYIVSRGSFELIKDGRQIAKCVAPDFFGELALLDDEPRYASAVANTDAELYFMDKITFSRLVDEQPAILKELTKLVIKYYRELGDLSTPHFSNKAP